MRRRRKFGRRKIKKLLIFSIFALLCCLLIFNSQVLPAMGELAKAAAKSKLSRVMSDAVKSETLAVSYRDLIDIKYTESGVVSTLEFDNALINSTASAVVKNIINRVESGEISRVDIPAGNLSGIPVLSGAGPKIGVKVLLGQGISYSMENMFEECGINQTIHKVMLTIDADVYILIPTRTVKIPISNTYCMAEAVIVGSVPDAYTKINRMDDNISEEDIDDLYDFGATTE